MAKNLGFIGAGNMASAIIHGAITTNTIDPTNIFVYDIDTEKAEILAKVLGITVVSSIEALEETCDILLLAVKPNAAQKALNSLKKSDIAIISIVAGLDTNRLKEYAPNGARVLRVMPNTPLLAGEGATVLSRPTTFTEEEILFAYHLFSKLGVVETTDESYMSAVVGVSGSGPAYVYLFIEALADAGVKHGLTRQTALKLAAQTVYGSAKMVLSGSKHPAELKDAVCSPGGTTIEACAVLEEEAFRGAIIKAVDACVKKADEL